MSYSYLLRGLGLILSLCLIGYLLHELQLFDILDAAWMDHWVRGKGIQGELVFLAAGAILTALGLPRQLIAFFAGYSFGLTLGLLLGVLASALGAAMAFWYARLLARQMVATHFPRQVQRLDAFTRDAPFLKTLAIRLLPVGNNLLTSLAAGVSGISAVSFLAGSTLGYVPQTLIFAMAGSGITVDPVLRIGGSVVLFLVSGVIAIYWYRRMQLNRATHLDELDAEPGLPANSRAG